MTPCPRTPDSEYHPIAHYKEYVGHGTEDAVKQYLQAVGYKVVPYGQEQILKGVTDLWKHKFTLDLPDVITKAPDFIVISPCSAYYFAVEVKYRFAWSENDRKGLLDDFTYQVKQWKKVHVVIASKTPQGPPESRDRHVRVADLHIVDNNLVVLPPTLPTGKVADEDVRWEEAEWSHFQPIENVFGCKGSSDALHSLVEAVKEMPDAPSEEEERRELRKRCGL